MNLKDVKVRKRPVASSIGDYVDSVLLDIASEQKGDGLAIIQSCWESIVGERIAQVAKPTKFESNILTLKVRSASWRQEMQSQSFVLIQTIREKLPDIDVQNIIFR